MSGQETERLRMAMAAADGHLIGTVGAVLSWHDEGPLPELGWQLLRASYDKCLVAEERWKAAVAKNQESIEAQVVALAQINESMPP